MQLDSGSVLGLAEVPISVMLLCYVACWMVLQTGGSLPLRPRAEVR